MAAATRAPVSHFEIAKLLHYEPGQQFALHADFLQPNTPELVQEIQLRGQRAATLLVYLNEELRRRGDGISAHPLRFKGKRGDALIFTNLDPAGAPDYDTVHAGSPPTSGEKWVLSQWIRTRPFLAVSRAGSWPTRGRLMSASTALDLSFRSSSRRSRDSRR